MNKFLLAGLVFISLSFLLSACGQPSSNLERVERFTKLDEQSYNNLKTFDKYAVDHWRNLNKTSGYTRYDYRSAAKEGFIGIRLAFSRAWYHESKDYFYAWLNKNIEWAQETNLYIVLELQGDLIYEDSNLWQDIASRYYSNGTIVGFSIANGRIGNDIAIDVFDAIRANNSQHPIIISKTDQIDFIATDKLVRVAGWRDEKSKEKSPYAYKRLNAKKRIATQSLPIDNNDWAIYVSKKVKIDSDKIVGFIPNIGVRGLVEGTLYFDQFSVLEFDRNGQLIGEIWSEPFTSESINRWWDWVVGLPKSSFKGERVLNDGYNDKASLSLEVNTKNPTGFGGWSGENLWIPAKLGHSYQIKGAMKGRGVTLGDGDTQGTIRFELDAYESIANEKESTQNSVVQLVSKATQATPSEGVVATNLIAAKELPISKQALGTNSKELPQYIVLGFDDNWRADGMNWVINMLSKYRNKDGSTLKASFYMNTLAMTQQQVDSPEKIIEIVKRLYTGGHEIGNHTYNHHKDINSLEWSVFQSKLSTLDKSSWAQKIDFAQNDLIKLVGIPSKKIQGFRAPYLAYNQAMFDVVKERGFIYDSSIEEGFASQFDGTNFRWPYQMNVVAPGYLESWAGNPKNPNRVKLGVINNVWQLPNYAMIVPNDSLSERYDFDKGLWARMKALQPSLSDHKITGFDYNLWVTTKLNKSEFLAVLKYNLDLRLQGNKAPYTVGLHSQYYFDDEWVKANGVQATAKEMREALDEFIQYAVSKDNVKITTGINVIRNIEFRDSQSVKNVATKTNNRLSKQSKNLTQGKNRLTGWVFADYIKKDGKYGFSKTQSLNVRYLPNTQIGNVLGKLNKGQKVKILVENKEWYLIHLP